MYVGEIFAGLAVCNAIRIVKKDSKMIRILCCSDRVAITVAARLRIVGYMCSDFSVFVG
jgi:hypothetical protein